MRGRALLAPLLILTFMMGAAAEGQLAVRFEPAESELGTIAADQQIAYSVTLSNPTETSVTVQLMATCGCIADGAGAMPWPRARAAPWRWSSTRAACIRVCSRSTSSYASPAARAAKPTTS